VVEKAAVVVRRWVQGDWAERQGNGETLCRMETERGCEGSIAREGRGIRRIGFEMRVMHVYWKFLRHIDEHAKPPDTSQSQLQQPRAMQMRVVVQKMHHLVSSSTFTFSLGTCKVNFKKIIIISKCLSCIS
jgi:hypothetical protein